MPADVLDEKPPTSDQLLKPETAKTAPKSRCEKVGNARDIVTRMMTDQEKIWRFFAKLKGQLDGNPPYDQSVLTANAESWRSNFNPMEAQAKRDKAITPHYDLYSSGPYYFFVRTRYGKNDEERDTFSKRISQLANRAVDEWYDFDDQNQTMIQDKVWFGKGFLFWPDENDWHYDYIPQDKVLVPNGSKTNVEKLTVMALLIDYKVDELWEMAGGDSAKDRGWNRAAVLEAIWNATPRDPTTGTVPDYLGLQQQLNDNDVFQGYSCEIIHTAHFLVKEFDGKITHGILTLDPLKNVSSSPDKPIYQDDWLFHSPGRYDNWRQIIAPFFLKNSEGSWKGASGMGKDLFSILEARARLWNSTWDLAFLDTGVWLQAKTPKAVQDIPLIQAGVFNVIPPDFEAQQTQIRGNIESPAEMIQLSDTLLQNNTGIYNQPFMDRQKGNPPTLGQVNLAYTDRTQLSNSMVARFYRQLDPFYSELCRRLFRDKKFRKTVEEEGLPLEAIEPKYVDSVKASRVIGNGSPQARQLAINQTASLFPALNEEGKSNWIDDAIAANADQTTVERWNPKRKDEQPSDHMNTAALENAALKEGAPVYVTPTQNDVIHLQEHFKGMAQAMASLKQVGDPQSVVAFTDSVGAHSGQHLQRLAADKTRKGAYQALLQQFKQLGQAADQVKEMVKQQMQQGAKQRTQAKQMDAMTQAKLRKEQLGMQTKLEKHRQQMQLKSESHRQDLVRRQQDMALNDAKTAAEIRRKNFSAFNDNQAES